MQVTQRHRLRTAATLPLLVLAGLAVGCTDDDGGSSPRVHAPAAGAAVGGSTNITWSNISGGNVRIDLSNDGGTTYGTLVTGATENDGSFAFDTTTAPDGANYRVRVQGDNSAQSGVFSIDNTDPTIVLTAPNAGDFVGLSGTIEWTTTDANPDTIEIVASDDSGVTYDITLATSAPDTGTFAWNALSLPDGNTYRVRVTPTDAAGNVGIAADSSGDFTLDLTAPTVTLTAPNGGETLSGVATATWTTTDTNPGTVTLRGSSDSGATFPHAVATDVTDTGTFDWNTGLIPDTTMGRLQVVATDLAGNTSTADASDADFTSENMRLIEVGHFEDVNGNATLDAGDTIFLRFDKTVVLNTPVATDLALAVSGDTLGTGASIAMGIDPDSILVTLGANPVLRHRGLFDASDVDTDSPSGIDVSATMAADAIESATGIDAAPTAPADIAPRAADETPLAAAATTARRAALGDLDGDGDADLVIAITGGSASEVWTNGGNADFTASATFDTDDTRDVAIGDVDGDGDLDVVTAVVGPNKVWLNDGAGNLSDSGQGLAANASQGVALGDLDGDGDLDLFFANGGVAAVADTVYLNDGSGAFVDTAQALGGSDSNAVALGDMDGDGDLDAFVAHDNDSNSRLYLNNGSGVFSASTSTLQTTAQDVALGDLDGDGDLDVWISVNGQNQVHLNTGDGTFETPFAFYGNNDNRGVALIDLDGDGDLDAVSAKNVDSSKYWLNNGDGTFTIDTVDAEVDNAVDVVAGRIDGDGDIDFVIVNDMGGHRPYRNSAAGGQPGADFAFTSLADGATADSTAVTVGDVDGNGTPDVIVTDAATGNTVLSSDGDGTFTALGTFGGTTGVGGDLFDADGDGDLDFLERLTSATTEQDVLWLNDGSGTFTDSGQTIGVGVWAPGDLDGDGDVDVVRSNGTLLEVYTNAAGTFSATGNTVAIVVDDAGVAPIDFDRDGDLDLVANDGADLVILENDGSGAFSINHTLVGSAATALAVADRDSDGDDDVLFAQAGAVDLLWLDNDGAPSTWAPVVASTRQDDFSRIAVFDADEDGTPDIIAYDPVDLELVYLPSNGVAQTLGLPATVDVGFADFDVDGDQDGYGAVGDGAAAADAFLLFD